MAGHDTEYMMRKIDFLMSRAGMHDEKSRNDPTNRHKLCSATLKRDAGAIAAYSGQGEKASMYLSHAGKSFADAGHFSGYSLLEICSEGAGYAQFRESFGQDEPIRHIVRALEAKQSGGESYSWSNPSTDLFKSWSSAQQRLDLYFVSRASKQHNESGLLRERLSEFRVTTVGDFGVPLWEYLDLVDAAATTGTEHELNDSVEETFQEIMSLRSRTLRMAREDWWHWDRLLNPAALIDMNLLALSILMLRNSGTTEPLDRIAMPFNEREPLVSLPMSIAKNFAADRG